MARTLIGNFRGPEGPRGERGPEGLEGQRGPQGETGPSGSMNDINPNLIPLSLSDWESDETYSTTTGEKQNYTGRSRLNKMVSVTKGETYTISDESTDVSQLSGIRWYIFDSGEFVESAAITRGGETQIEMTGDQITFSLYPMGGDGFSNPHRFLEHGDLRLLFKLEKGSESTPIIKAIHVNQQRIDKLDIPDPEYMTSRMLSTDLTAGEETPLSFYGIEGDSLRDSDDYSKLFLREGFCSLNWHPEMVNVGSDEKVIYRLYVNDTLFIRKYVGGNSVSFSADIKLTSDSSVHFTVETPAGSNVSFNTSGEYSNVITIKRGQ